MNDHELLNECVTYFKQNKGFDRVFQQIRDKYKSLGTMGGTVRIANLTSHEKEALTGFLKKDYLNKESAVIHIKSFQRALEKTKFMDISFDDVLNSYFMEEIQSNRYVREQYELKRTHFFCTCGEAFKDTPASKWLEHVISTGKNAYKTLVRRYDVDAQKLKIELDAVCRAFNHLPYRLGEKQSLPIFATKITRDPHAFDIDSPCGQLMLYSISFLLGIQVPAHAQERAEALYQVGIMVDEISNFVLCAGLNGYRKKELHPGWDGFNKACEPVHASLINLSKLETIRSSSGTVYVVENPSVFLTILDCNVSRSVPLVCTYGNLKLACFVLLDMLAKEGTQIFYSGDFDPEGLMIADALKNRYKDQLTLWRYTKQDYLSAISNKPMSSSRIKKLDSIKDENLKSLSLEIKHKMKAGYQEMMIDKLVEDIKSWS